jgi:hypothetical protein
LKVKVKMSLCLTNWALRHEGVWRNGCIDPHFLDLGSSWKRVVTFTPRPLYPLGKNPGTHCIWGRVGSRVGLNDVKKILDPIGTRTEIPSAVQLEASSYTDSVIPAPVHFRSRNYTQPLSLGKQSSVSFGQQDRFGHRSQDNIPASPRDICPVVQPIASTFGR